MFKLIPTSSFKKGLKRIKNDKKTLLLLEQVLSDLVLGRPLSEKHKPHELHGKLALYMECHIKPNLILIYFVDRKEKLIYLQEIGSHGKIFK